MPSLRRTLSSPTVRASPYRYPSTPSVGSTTRAGGGTPRRASGSNAARRRVLADIDWWRVQDGQRDQGSESSEEERDAPSDESLAEAVRQLRGSNAAGVSLPAHAVGPAPPAWQPAAGASAGAFEMGMDSSPFFLDITMHVPDLTELVHPLPEFEDLSLSDTPPRTSPRTPSRRRWSQSSQSSVSSLQSTPESLYPALFPVPTLETSFVDMFFASDDAFSLECLVSPTPVPAPVPRAIPLSKRSASYSSIESQLSAMRRRRRKERRFDDAIPSPPPFFSLTRADVDDLFD